MNTTLPIRTSCFAKFDTTAYGIVSFLWACLGLSTALLFQIGFSVPLELMVCVALTTTVVAIRSINITRLSLLPRFMVLVYVLPFSTAVGYLLFPDFLYWPHHKVAREYAADHELISGMLMLGMVGLFGLLTGIKFGGFWFGRPKNRNAMPNAERVSRNPTLSGPLFLLLLVVAYICSRLSAPGVTIFTAAYASEEQGHSLASTVNFNALGNIAYIILILLFIDGERERQTSFMRRIKIRATLLMSAYVFLFHQLLVGSRTVIGLVVALTFLYLTGPDLNLDWWRAKLLQRRRMLKLALPLTVIFCAFVALGSMRSTLSHSMPSLGDIGDFAADSFTGSTWNYVALTNLGMALEIRDGEFEYLYGKTYTDYVLSLPPGILTKWLDYRRPMEANRGPGWWYHDLSAGGVHAIVVPYKNFGVVGVFLVMALFGVFGSYCEIRNTSMQFWPRLLFGAVASMQTHWFWYADMNIIRGVMIAVILGVFYHLATISSRQISTRRPSAW